MYVSCFGLFYHPMFFACSELFLENDGIVLEFSEGSRRFFFLMGSVEEHHHGDFNEVESANQIMGRRCALDFEFLVL